jgi:endonuclease/exonuclease/phosphatase family metal-dependent hydrolase
VAAATPGTAVVEPTDRDIRVISFNVHQGFANDGVVDPDAFFIVLQEEDPDIVLLQESDTPRFTSGNLDIATYLSERLGYHLIYGQPTREQAFGGAILSRYPVLGSHVYPLPSGSDDRFFTEARLDIRGTPVWVYAVHFTLPREDRLAETQVLLAQAATRTGPGIIGGDFNSCPSMLCPDEENKGDAPDDVYLQMTAKYRDPSQVLGRDANDTAAFTYDATAPDQRIDYLFVTSDIEVISADTVKTPAARRASDHLPVRADLRIPGI